MTLTLYVYNYGEHKLRKEIRDKKETLPNQKGKEISNPTLKWTFQLMQGIGVILINTKKGKSEEIVTNIDEVRRKIILLLGNRTPIIYKIKESEFT